jgi:hypothetical protein
MRFLDGFINCSLACSLQRKCIVNKYDSYLEIRWPPLSRLFSALGYCREIAGHRGNFHVNNRGRYGEHIVNQLLNMDLYRVHVSDNLPCPVY